MIITIYHKIYIKVCQVFIFVSVINLTQVWCYYYKPVIILNHACFDKVQNPYKYLYIALYNFINIYFLINANNCVSVNWRFLGLITISSMLYKGLASHVAYTSSQLCGLTTPGHRLAKLGITLLTPNCAHTGRGMSTRWCLILSYVGGIDTQWWAKLYNLLHNIYRLIDKNSKLGK